MSLDYSYKLSTSDLSRGKTGCAKRKAVSSKIALLGGKSQIDHAEMCVAKKRRKGKGEKRCK